MQVGETWERCGGDVGEPWERRKHETHDCKQWRVSHSAPDAFKGCLEIGVCEQDEVRT